MVRFLFILGALGIIAAVIVLAVVRPWQPDEATETAGVSPATMPATAPATAPAPAPPAPRPREYMDVVRLHHPDFPTTQPLIIPLTMPEAARFVIDDPIYLDFIGELWITRPDAETTTNVFKTVHEQSTHVLREQVVFVHRWPDDTGMWQPQLIVRKPDGGHEIVTRNARQDIASAGNLHAYEWHRAFGWNDVIVVPTQRGISIIRPDRRPMELHHEFVPADQFDPDDYSPVQALLDWRGLVAWMPWEHGKRGSTGAARFLKDTWTPLDAKANWPDKLLHLVPLFDGSVLQLVVRDDQTVEVALAILDPAEVDPNAVNDLIEKLSDPDPQARLDSFNQLTLWGPGIFPLLEAALPNQPPEARIRLQQLLDAKTQPMLGGMLLQRGPVQILARSDFGGNAMIHSEAGVMIPQGGIEDPVLVAPASIILQPGRVIALAPNELVEQLKPKGRRLSIVRGEWILNDDVEGPRWWLSNHLTPPLLKESEREFGHFIGQDGRGRWLFRRSPTDSSPTLIIDPTLPDPTPRLPVWVYKIEGMQVGWTKDNWPAIKRGGAWALVENDWKVIDETKEKFLTNNDPLPQIEPPSTLPATMASTMPTPGPATQESLGEPILVEQDGTRFYDGRQTLTMLSPDGDRTVWPLPPEATGSGPVHLFRAGENGLFLFNSPGRVLRIQQTPDGPAQPFKLEATFTRRIPNTESPDRIWLDPAGRIVIAHDGNTLAICFPGGRIPPQIAKKMTSQDLREAEADH